jgi:micrococcal nuclease
VTTSTVKVITRLVGSVTRERGNPPVIAKTLFPVIVVAAVLAGCSVDEGSGDDPALPQVSLYKVVKVIDGDTIDVDVNGTTETVQLIGVDAPESHHPTKPDECFGAEATEHLASLLKRSKKVRLEADPLQSDRDNYDRLLRYVFPGMTGNVNLAMIRDGYAREYNYGDLPYANRDAFVQAQTEAKAAKLGLWSACAEPPPSAEPSQSAKPDTDPRFDTCTEAKQAGYGPYVKGKDPEYAWYEDRDGDGVVCE